ncbi:unnamed protein product, partial [Meganyctiphanes norvegica]
TFLPAEGISFVVISRNPKFCIVSPTPPSLLCLGLSLPAPGIFARDIVIIGMGGKTLLTLLLRLRFLLKSPAWASGLPSPFLRARRVVLLVLELVFGDELLLGNDNADPSAFTWSNFSKLSTFCFKVKLD